MVFYVADGLLCIAVLALTYFGVHCLKTPINRLFSHLPHQLDFFKHYIIGGLYFLGILVAISMVPSLQNMARALLVSSGIAAIILGIASQAVFSNVISGIYLAITKPFAINDSVRIGDFAEGVVKAITLRYTILYDEKNNKKFFVPNNYVASQVITKF